MGVPNQFRNGLNVQGGFACDAFNPPTGCVTDASIAAGVVGSQPNLIQTSKIWQQYSKNWSQAGTAVTERRVIHVSYGTAGQVLALWIGCVGVPAGAATVTVNLYKNGTSILTGVVTLNSATVAYALTAASFGAGVTYATNDVFEIVVTATAGGGTLPTEVFAQLIVNEQPY